MKYSFELKILLHSAILAGSLLNLTGCHDNQHIATPTAQLPLIERAVMTPAIRADGSIQIDQQQIIQHIGTEGVFIVSANKARFRMIKAGKIEGKWATIISGLDGTEHILSGPYDSVFDGSPVAVLKNE